MRIVEAAIQDSEGKLKEWRTQIQFDADEIETVVTDSIKGRVDLRKASVRFCYEQDLDEEEFDPCMLGLVVTLPGQRKADVRAELERSCAEKERGRCAFIRKQVLFFLESASEAARNARELLRKDQATERACIEGQAEANTRAAAMMARQLCPSCLKEIEDAR